jgi:hypothetical protein
MHRIAPYHVSVANDPGTQHDGTTVVGTLIWALAQVKPTAA